MDVVDDDVDDGASWRDATINLRVLRQLSLNEGHRDVAAQSLFDAPGQVRHLRQIIPAEDKKPVSSGGAFAGAVLTVTVTPFTAPK